MNKTDIAIEAGFSKKAVNLAKGIVFGYIFSLVLIFIAALIFTYTPLSEDYLGGTVSVITVLGIVFSSLLVSSKNKTQGYLHGMITGVLYMALLYTASIVFFKGVHAQRSIFSVLLTGIVCGALGGIIGVNIGK